MRKRNIFKILPSAPSSVHVLCWIAAAFLVSNYWLSRYLEGIPSSILKPENHETCEFLAFDYLNLTDIDNTAYECRHSSCAPYTTVVESDDEVAEIKWTASGLTCERTRCCAVVYSVLSGHEREDSMRFPDDNSCYPLSWNKSQLVYPTVYTEALETTCTDVCNNLTVTNFHPLLITPPKTIQKLIVWKKQPMQARRMTKVIILAVQGLNRENIKLFPRTLAILTNISSSTGHRFVNFPGFAMIDKDPGRNFLSVLTGYNYTGLSSNCGGKRLKHLKALDSCPFIWKDFRNLDYVSLFMDELHLLASMLPKSAFESEAPVRDFFAQPTDFYIPASFMLRRMGKPEGSKMNRNEFASTSIQQFILDCVLRFQEKFLKYPSLAITRIDASNALDSVLIDTSIALFLKAMKPYKEYTVTIILGLPENNSIRPVQPSPKPILFISPSSMQDHSLLHNLHSNSQKMITTLDLYQTLSSLLLKSCTAFGSSEEDCAKFVNKKQNLRYAPSRNGLSIFDSLIHKRSCADAGIPVPLCYCKSTPE